MKKVLFIICIAMQLASCREQDNHSQHTPAYTQVKGNTSLNKFYTVRDIVRQFDFNLSAIYGDVFSNKSWH